MRNLRLAIRQLLRSPGFTLIAILTLALGIGVNASMFSLTNTLLLAPTPFAKSDELVRIFRTSPQSQSWPIAPGELFEMRERTTTLNNISGFVGANVSLSEPGVPAERLRGLKTSMDFFTALGVPPVLGRTYTPNDEVAGQDQLVVLSHSFWQRRFASDPGIVGRTIRIDGKTMTVLGVMPPNFAYPLLWGPIDLYEAMSLLGDIRKDYSSHWMQAVGRLKPGATISQANAEMKIIGSQIAQRFPSAGSNAMRALSLSSSVMDSVYKVLVWLTLGLSGCVLLIACGNLANLQLARTLADLRRFAIQAALGASRRQLMAQLITQSLILSAVGGALGVIFAMWTNDALGKRIMIGEKPGLDVPLDAHVLLFALIASVVTGLIFGTVPAWVATRQDVNTILKSQARGSTGDRSHHRVRNVLIVVQFALALILLTGADFFVRGLKNFVHQDGGWQTENILLGSVSIPFNDTYSGPEKHKVRYELQKQILEKVSAIPGVESAAIASAVPVFDFGWSNDAYPDGTSPERGRVPMASQASVTPGYCSTLGIAIKEGEGFPDNLPEGGPQIALINETMARAFWPNESAVGKHIRGYRTAGGDGVIRVVGVFKDIKYSARLNAPDTAYQMFIPTSQEAPHNFQIIVRTRMTPTALTQPLREAVASVAPDLPVFGINSASSSIELALSNFSLIGFVLGAFALLGLLLSGIGLYGVIAASVAQRTSEFGIRLALGATVQNILRLVLSQGVRLVVAGSVVGVSGAVAMTILLRRTVPNVPAGTITALSGTTFVLVAIALFACWLPARRATRVNPIVALRTE
jgi:putative ABC transport system permease protein